MAEKDLGEAYDLAAREYFATRTESKGITGFFNRNAERPLIFRMVPADLKGKKLLDIGCGPGIHLKEYIARGAAGIGVDISQKMLNIAQEYCPESKFYKCSAENLNFANESFDIITSSLVYDHVEDIEKAFDEVKRVLKKGGLFIFSIPHAVRYMFRDSKDGEFVPTNSYFDREKHNHNIAGIGRIFPGFPRPLQDYFQRLLRKGFKLEDFVESEPQESWKEEGVYEFYLYIPPFCFFKWKK